MRRQLEPRISRMGTDPKRKGELSTDGSDGADSGATDRTGPQFHPCSSEPCVVGKSRSRRWVDQGSHGWARIRSERVIRRCRGWGGEAMRSDVSVRHLNEEHAHGTADPVPRRCITLSSSPSSVTARTGDWKWVQVHSAMPRSGPFDSQRFWAQR